MADKIVKFSLDWFLDVFSSVLFFCLIIRPPPTSTLFPYTTLFRSETRIERDTCTPMFIAALFIIARTWKQPRCLSADEWITKLWYRSEEHTSELQSPLNL